MHKRNYPINIWNLSFLFSLSFALDEHVQMRKTSESALYIKTYQQLLARKPTGDTTAHELDANNEVLSR